MRINAILTVLCALSISVTAQERRSPADGIRDVLDLQVRAWNDGDIEGYMAGYWRSDSTVFVSGGTYTTGFDSVLARYKRGYATKERMGELKFEEIRIRMLTPTVGVATGIWRLRRSSDQPWGRFTLLVEKKAGKWRVTYDHTSLGN